MMNLTDDNNNITQNNTNNNNQPADSLPTKETSNEFTNTIGIVVSPDGNVTDKNLTNKEKACFDSSNNNEDDEMGGQNLMNIETSKPTCENNYNELPTLLNGRDNNSQASNSSKEQSKIQAIEHTTNPSDFNNNYLNHNSNAQNEKSLILNGSYNFLPVSSSSSISTLKSAHNSIPEKQLENGFSNQVEKMPTELNQHDIYHPSTTTVNLSESNQSVYFMMQSAPSIDLITAPVASNPKLKTSPTSTPNISKKLYSPKHLDNSQILGSVTNNCVMTLNSPLSSSSSSLNTSPNGTTKVVRDERRRANHNEVERRRRDNINKWIVELSKVIPDCSNDQSKHGQSKGGILEKTVQYLNDIKQTNKDLQEHIRSLQIIKQENEILKEQNEMYKKENQYFKSKLEINNESSMLMETIEEIQPSLDISDNNNNNNQIDTSTLTLSSGSEK